jgi:4-hydroxy-tetrahydrodipicolinate synthase
MIPVFVPLTPFKPSLEIDFEMLEQECTFLADAGVRHLFVNGSGSEYGSFTFDEKVKVAQCIRQSFQGECTVHISSASYLETIELAQACQESADSFALLPPLYHQGAGEDGVFAFFEKVVPNVARPVMLYNNPTIGAGIELSNTLIQRLVHSLPAIQSIKDSRPASEATVQLRSDLPQLSIYRGASGGLAFATKYSLQGIVSINVGDAEQFVELQKELCDSPAPDLANVERKENVLKQNFLQRLNGSSRIATAKRDLAGVLKGFPTRCRPPMT